MAVLSMLIWVLTSWSLAEAMRQQEMDDLATNRSAELENPCKCKAVKKSADCNKAGQFFHADQTTDEGTGVNLCCKFSDKVHFTAYTKVRGREFCSPKTKKFEGPCCCAMSDWDSFKDVCLPVRGSPTKNGAIVTGEVMKLYRGFTPGIMPEDYFIHFYRPDQWFDDVPTDVDVKEQDGDKVKRVLHTIAYNQGKETCVRWEPLELGTYRSKEWKKYCVEKQIRFDCPKGSMKYKEIGEAHLIGKPFDKWQERRRHCGVGYIDNKENPHCKCH